MCDDYIHRCRNCQSLILDEDDFVSDEYGMVCSLCLQAWELSLERMFP